MKIGGIEFGEAWRPDKNHLTVVVPLIRNKEVKREYVTFEEIKDDIDIEDTGHIDSTKIKHSSKIPVFIRTGTIFKGIGTQSRAVNSSTIIMPEKTEIEIPVSCVHASHAIHQGSIFSAGGSTPSGVTAHLFRCASQGKVWDSVSSYSSRLAYFSSAGGQSASRQDRVRPDNLVQNMEQVSDFSEQIDSIISKMPRSENQVGVMILGIEGVIGMELFDSPKSWDAVSKSIIEKYGEDLVKKQDKPLFELNKDAIKPKIEAYMKKITEFEGKVVVSDGNSETRIHEEDDIVAEWSMIDNKIIHIITARKEPEPTLKQMDGRFTRCPRRGASPVYGISSVS